MLAAGLLLVAGVSAAAEDPFDFDLTPALDDSPRWQLSGYLEARGRVFTAADATLDIEAGDWLSRRLQAFAELSYRGEHWRSRLSGTVEHDAAKRDFRAAYRGEIREAAVTFITGDTQLTAGRERLAWGTADGASTIDRVNAIDFRDPVGNGRTASRRPSWLVRINRATSLGDFEAVWLPRGRDRKRAETNSPWEAIELRGLRATGAALALPVVIEDPHDHEYGLRFTHYGQGFDWGLAVFDGDADFPTDVRMNADAVRAFPARRRTWNANTAIGFGASTLRGELAYTEQTEQWQAILGWDRTFFESLYLNVQAFWDSAPAQRNTHGATFAVTQGLLEDAATIGVRGQIANRDQFAVESFIEWQPRDGLLLSIRALQFGGDSGTPLGAFAKRDFVDVTLRWSI
ncbi:MAG: hypothetical protein AAF515_03635 [Pseudomonadota bacterium]